MVPARAENSTSGDRTGGDFDYRLTTSGDARLAWLNPLWVSGLSFSVPHTPAECSRRLERFAGRPGLFTERATAGMVSDQGFRLVWRLSNGGISSAVALARGRLTASAEGTRVEVRTTYAPWSLAWILVLYVVLISVPVLLPAERSTWGIYSPAIVVGSWILGSWSSHRCVEALQGVILSALMGDGAKR
jgi:hypothetical protein